MRLPAAAVLLASLTVFTPARDARADYDMSGKWLMLGPTGSPVQRLTITQQSGELTVASESGSVPWSGTVNETTGEFHLQAAFYVYPMCETWTIDGTVNAAGTAFTASRHTGTFYAPTPHLMQCNASTIAVTGTRCGNTELDAGEDCDLGDAADGDCCSSGCTFESSVSPCGGDGNDCTGDVCDGAGACTHVERSGSCVTPGGCGEGDCSAGSCVVTSSLPAGTSCDLDASVCTPDACDDAGACVAGAEVDCSPCGICDDVDGCIAYPIFCSGDVEEVKLSLRTGDDPSRNALKMSMRREYPFGDPTADLDLAVCLYREVDGISRPVLNVLVPSGALWDQKGDGRYLYKDRDRTSGGVSKMSLDTQRGFKVVAARENLPFAFALPVDSPFTARIFEAGEPYWGQMCFEQTLLAELQSDSKYKGSYTPPAP